MKFPKTTPERFPPAAATALTVSFGGNRTSRRLASGQFLTPSVTWDGLFRPDDDLHSSVNTALNLAEKI
jgi:hypothetical protein